MLLRDLGHTAAADAIHRALSAVLVNPANHTRDLGGQASTEQLAAAVLDEMETP